MTDTKSCKTDPTVREEPVVRKLMMIGVGIDSFLTDVHDVAMQGDELIVREGFRGLLGMYA